MPAVTIGVPVYNGGALLSECLECLSAQTFPDFEVLIYDNASTDATASIAQSWAARDNRFKYFRHPQNRGPMQNFLDVLNAATADYFMWRAHDDLSAPNFVEVLHRLLVDNPKAALAVCEVRSFSPGRVEKRRPVPDFGTGSRAARLRRVLFQSQASWFYGLWRRQALVEGFTAARAAYPYEWAHDHRLLFDLILDELIVGSPATYFVQRTTEPERRQIAVDEVSAAEMRRVRSVFARQCRAAVARRSFSPAERALLALSLFSYVNRRTYKRSRVAKARRRELRGKERHKLTTIPG